MKKTLHFYVYAYINAITGNPYYIGKGKNKRAYSKHAGVSLPKNKSNILFIETKLSEIGALAIERKLIRWWGRKDLGTGVLLNRTDGGEGVSGAIFGVETRKKMSTAKLGKPLPPRTDEHSKKIGDALRGRTTDWGKNPANRLAISKAMMGRKISKDWRAKISTTLSGRTYYMYSCICCKKEVPVNNITQHYNSHYGLNKSKKIVSCSCVVCKRTISINNLTQHTNRKHYGEIKI